MNHDFRNVVCQLKFISFVKKRQKINTKHNSVYDNNWYDCIYRSILTPENRLDTVNYIQNTLDDAFKELSIAKNDTQAKIIEVCLNETKCGIQNLMYTYQEDPFIKGKFESMMIEIENKIGERSSHSKEKCGNRNRQRDNQVNVSDVSSS